MKISIVIPAYNKADYLQACLESCLQQTFDDYEVVVINDGSTDHTAEVCDSMAQTHRKLKVIHTVNGGVTAARRIGVEHAQGDYITFVDADDQLLPRSLQTLYEAMMASQADEVIGTFIDQHKNHFTTHRSGFVRHDTLIKEILSHKARFCLLWGVLYKKQWLQGCLWAPKIIRSGEDKLMQVMYLMKQPKVFFIDTPVYVYTMYLPNDRTLNLPEEQAYDDCLRKVLQPQWDTYRHHFVWRQLKQYENFIDQRLFGQFEDYYRRQIKPNLNREIPLADRIAFCLPPRIAYYPIHWRKHFNP